MKKKNTKKQLTYWLSVAVVGIALGLGLQFVRAWTEPTQAPPNGNVGAPINTSAISQAKGTGNTPRADKPGSIVAGDFCLPGGGKCLSEITSGSSSSGTSAFCQSNAGGLTLNRVGFCENGACYVCAITPPDLSAGMTAWGAGMTLTYEDYGGTNNGYVCRHNGFCCENGSCSF